MHTHTHTHTHTHRYTHMHAHTHACTHILYRQMVVKDSVAQLKYSKRNVSSLVLKEEREAEFLMSWGRLFQMWGPKCDKTRKPWVEVGVEHACV